MVERFAVSHPRLDSDGEVVEALPIVTGQTERAVQQPIEVASQCRAASTCSLGSQIQGLADHSRFPEYPGRPAAPRSRKTGSTAPAFQG